MQQNVIVTENGVTTEIDMSGLDLSAVTAEQVTARFAAAGVSVRMLTPEEAEQRQREEETRRQEHEAALRAWEARRDGLLDRLSAIASGGPLQLDADEVEMLRRGIEPDYSDE